MELSYTRESQGIRIEKIEEPEALVVIPEAIDGMAVTELAPYVLAGSGVEELYLPSGLRKVGAYAFYNCEKFRRLHCFNRLYDLGTGLFAGTKGVEFLDFHLFEGELSCLKDLISDLRQTLRVSVHGAQEARLIFPEYFEESVEHTPARMLYIDTHGCGHRYRYCFQGREFSYRDYDSLFPHAQVQEAEALVTELALLRVLYPCGLTEEHDHMYRNYLKEHWQAAGTLMIEADCSRSGNFATLDRGLIPWLAEYVLTERQQADTLIGLAQKLGDTQAVSWLMDYRHETWGNRPVPEQNGAERTRRFEL